MKICPMTEADCEKTGLLMKECFSVPWSVEGLKEMFHTEGYCSFLAKEEEEVIGYVGMKMVLDEADITNVAVLPSHRKKGIARKLLKQLLEEAKKQNLHSIYLEVRASNIAAVTLYEHAGLKKSDRERIITIIRGKMQDLCSGRHKDASSYQYFLSYFFV